MNTSTAYTTPDTARVEIPTGVLSKLISSGLIHGSECKCLDADTKQLVWQLLLSNSFSNEVG